MTWFVIADDLTGAADASVHLAGGWPVRVTFPPGPTWSARFSGVVTQVRDTESRALPEGEAARLVGACCEELRTAFGAGTRVFKKVDSTLRGSFEAELLAAREALGRRLVVLAPSLPGQRRTVVRGRLLVEGVDRGPVLAKAVWVGLEDLREGEDVLAGKTGPVLVVDAETDADLDLLAAQVSRREDLLPAGSAGFAAALARREGPAAELPPPRPSAIVVAAGSRQLGVRRQVEALRAAGIAGVTVHDLLDQPEGDPVEMAAGLARKTVASVRSLPAGTAIVATGGDVALAICRELEAAALWPQGELLPGVVWNQVEGWDLLLVTKAGGFGGEDVLLRTALKLLDVEPDG